MHLGVFTEASAHITSFELYSSIQKEVLPISQTEAHHAVEHLEVQCILVEEQAIHMEV